ncbi:hypothetical protein KFK09_023458 [Dendrobium nobile]|uniref:Uncharacterized protein n=1 Tax=Dendrobium nobile TaxID=94219 RepID=A0A8T3ASN5_DENNO|nr:hypothetical protein KFK09_023443 [Dendrobium nobile]KAI0497130.1 hypothetical protein KFK09_023458 [Dendrobium nobile]
MFGSEGRVKGSIRYGEERRRIYGLHVERANGIRVAYDRGLFKAAGSQEVGLSCWMARTLIVKVAEMGLVQQEFGCVEYFAYGEGVPIDGDVEKRSRAQILIFVSF